MWTSSKHVDIHPSDYAWLLKVRATFLIINKCKIRENTAMKTNVGTDINTRMNL